MENVSESFNNPGLEHSFYRLLGYNKPSYQMMRIDLHGLTVKETKTCLLKKFREVEEKNITEIYIITGRGNHRNADGTRGVLYKILRKLLKPYSSHIAEINPEIGAYRVVLKKQSQRRPITAVLEELFGEEILDHYLQVLSERAEKNDEEALIILGIRGLKDSTMREEALDYLEKAKKLESLEAYILLGEFYLNQSQYKKAISYLQYAAKQGSPDGMHLFAGCYLLGQGVKQNDKIAVDWLSKAADAGHAYAQCNLGQSYYFGDYTQQDTKLAVKYLTLAVNQGVSAAMVLLARCYATGDGVEQDTQKAFNLYLQAAQWDEIFALYQVGEYLCDGRSGEPISREKAFPWFMRAAQLGDPDSQAQAGLSLISGEKKDIKQGIEWLDKCIAQNNKFGHYIMGITYLEGTLVKKDETKGYHHIKCSAELGYCHGQFDLAIILMTGSVGIERDFNEGKQWLLKAAEQYDRHAINVLQYLHENPNNVEDDKLLAETCFARAIFAIFTKIDKEEGLNWFTHAIAHGSDNARHFIENWGQKDVRIKKLLQTKANFFSSKKYNTLEYAKALYAERKYNEVIQIYYQLLRGDQSQDKSIVLCNMGHCFYGLKCYQQAIEHYSQAIKINSNRIAAYQWRAKAYRKQTEMPEFANNKTDLIEQAEQDEQFVIQYNKPTKTI